LTNTCTRTSSPNNISLIRQHECLDLAAKTSREELALGIHDYDGDSDVNEIDLEDISNASDSDDHDMQDDDEMQEFFPEDGELLQELDCGVLTQGHRQRVLQRNTSIWSMLHFLPVLCTRGFY